MQFPVSFPGGSVQYLMQASYRDLVKLAPAESCVFVTDENLARLYPELLQGMKCVVIPAGEGSKNLGTIAQIIEEMLRLEVERNSFIVGVGGGVVTDIAGFVASVYMRGVRFGFMPTSLLGMVDAAIGGKNGVNIGVYKNIAGSTRQPEFILFDTSFLQTLPREEWRNGFAEVIKYACLFDKELFDELREHGIEYYQCNEAALQSLIKRCVDWKNKIVQADEQEKGERKLLNFGHTLGHAIENLYQLPHGYAVAIGMMAASRISVEVNGLNGKVTEQLAELLQRYELPADYSYDLDKVMDVLVKDKKRAGSNIDYIVLDEIGRGSIRPLTQEQIRNSLSTMQDAVDR